MTRADIIATFFIILAIAAVPASAAREYSYTYGHLSRVDGEVTLQRAAEPEPEAGALNVPVMPGDRLWTPSRSRAEVAFADGTRVRVDERTKLDFIEIDSELIVRLWSGSVILRVDEPRVDVRIDTPAGTVFPAREGLYRIDLDGDRLVVSVVRGSAELSAAEGSVVLGAGEASDVSAGSPSRPYPYNTARLDAFDRWSDELEVSASTSRDVVVRSLPREVHYYARELHHHGAWYQEPDYGYVWYPSVSASWAPYRHGRWHYTRFGYTWISYEPWGWAPYHYGRWGYGHRGWYWIPGASWGPAWVSFAFGPSWIGWSPLGYHGRAVFGFDHVFYPHGRYRGYRGGKAVPRHVYDQGAGWNFVGQQQFTARSARARLRASQVRASASRARVVDSGTVLGRDLRPRARARSLAGAAGSGSASPAFHPSRTNDGSFRSTREANSVRGNAARARTRTRAGEGGDQSTTVRERSAPRGSRQRGSAWSEQRGASRPSNSPVDRSRATRSRAAERGSSVNERPDRSGWRERATTTRTPARATERGVSREIRRPSSSERGSAWRERSSSRSTTSPARRSGAGVETRTRSSRPRTTGPATRERTTTTERGNQVERRQRPRPQSSERGTAWRERSSRSNTRPRSASPARVERRSPSNRSRAVGPPRSSSQGGRAPAVRTPQRSPRGAVRPGPGGTGGSRGRAPAVRAPSQRSGGAVRSGSGGASSSRGRAGTARSRRRRN